MKLFKLALASAVATAALGGAALAQDTGTVAFNVGVVSDYVFRGLSQTDENPALQGGVDFSSGLAYGGIWGSNVDFLDDTSAEIDVYGGIKPTVGAVSLDLGVIYYGYVDEPKGANYANWEYKAAASVPAGPATLGAAVFYSNDTFGAAGEATYLEVNGAVPVGPVLLSGAYGNQEFKGVDDYNLWNIGAAYTFAEKFTLDVRYYGTDNEAFTGALGDERFVVGLKAAF